MSANPEKWSLMVKASRKKQVLSKLAAISRVDKNQPVRLRGDGIASWQTMVGVIDIVERAGIWNISFATQRPGPN